MDTTEKLIQVTPRELEAILDRLDADQVTRLAIVGPGNILSSNPNDWPEQLRGATIYQTREMWLVSVDRVNRFKQLNQLASWHVDIGDIEVHALAEHLTQLKFLSLCDSLIGEDGASAIAENQPQLITLELSENKIGSAGVRAIAKRLTQLTSLDVSYNQIGDSGACAIAEHLNQLTSLKVDGNHLGNAGALAFAKNLTRLTLLSLNRTQIGEAGIRAIVEHLTQLQSLWLDDTQFGQSSIEMIGKHLRRLMRLSICNIKAVYDIEPLAQLPMLQSLNLDNTSVNDLSPFSERIVSGWPLHLRVDMVPRGIQNGLSVAGCPLVRPTIEIAQQGPEAVQNYFRELAEQGEDFLYEAKVLILGEGGAGKTSLMRRLYHPDRELPAEDETTRGIEIHRHDFVGNHGRPFRLNVWDFGGQQIYHATHQFFLTKNSLYVLVDDTRKDHKTIHDKGFKFWLEVVETLSEGSPLLIFQNEKGDRSKAIDQPGILGRFTNVLAVHRGNLEHTGSVKSLQQAIECCVQQLPHIGERVPKKWVAIRAELEQLAEQQPFISQDEYFGVYRKHLAFDRTKALYLSRYLHDLGAFLHFQDDPVLRKTVILQNQWATEAVFRILDDETIKSQLGRFSTADCLRLWASSTYAEMDDELRGLMEQFEICYRLSSGDWLAPQLLSPSKPAELSGWARPDDLVMRFQYPFLPRGLVCRLMVRQHRFVRRLEHCWAHGAFFERDGAQVLVEETAKGNEIELRARGPEHKTLLSVLSSDLEALNDSFKGLQGRVEKLVPCICATCRQTTEPEMFKQSVLVHRKHAGKKLTIECHASGDDVNLLELLDGLKLEQLPNWAAKPSQAADVRTVRIFLASSAELKEDRDAFDLYFRQQNDRLREQGIYLQIVRWEFSVDAMSRTRLQDEYNQQVRECDLFVGLFKTKVGKYTEEEFDEAWKKCHDTGSPKIFTYFREYQLSGDEIREKRKDIDSLEAFEKKLAELGHFRTKYKDVEHLKLQFYDQLKRFLQNREASW